MQAAIDRVKLAITELQAGKMIVLTDSPDREDEGDLIVAAEMATTQNIGFMIRYCSGIICLSMPKSRLEELSLPLMVNESDNTSCRGTPFTISIDAKNDISTGVSAEDRAKTILTACETTSPKKDLVYPGHIFPLQANDLGVLARAGHTEGSVDLMKIAGLKEAAVLCEIMNPDGSMTRGKELIDFAKEHDLHMLSIEDIIAYRLQNENFITDTASAKLPMDQYGDFTMSVIKNTLDDKEHIILEKPFTGDTPLVRVHSSCITGDLFHSLKCDCHRQLHYSLDKISKEGGILIYLNQEGRGIGLFNKIKAYALQETGLDTVEANTELGLPEDSRDYSIAANILRLKNIKRVRLLSNNPKKSESLLSYGIDEVIRESLPAFQNDHNVRYLNTKMTKLNHDIDLDAVL